MTTWINNDGLRVRFGPTETEKARVTEYTTDGPQRLVEVVIDADFLPDETVTAGITLDSFVFPSNAVIEEVAVSPESETWASQGSATLQVRLVDLDGSDPDNVGSAFSIANLNGQNVQVVQVAEAEKKYINLVVGVDAFDTGKGTLLIKYSIPKVETDTIAPNKPYTA